MPVDSSEKPFVFGGGGRKMRSIFYLTKAISLTDDKLYRRETACIFRVEGMTVGTILPPMNFF
jgi:hypothetical protein